MRQTCNQRWAAWDDLLAILLVEDEFLIQHIAVETLNDGGFKVDTAASPGGCHEVRSRTMQAKLLHDAHDQRTYAIILASGDEVMTSLTDFVSSEKIIAAQISAIGALSDVVLEYFDWEKKEYVKIPVREQVEVA